MLLIDDYWHHVWSPLTVPLRPLWDCHNPGLFGSDRLANLPAGDGALGFSNCSVTCCHKRFMPWLRFLFRDTVHVYTSDFLRLWSRHDQRCSKDAWQGAAWYGMMPLRLSYRNGLLLTLGCVFIWAWSLSVFHLSLSLSPSFPFPFLFFSFLLYLLSFLISRFHDASSQRLPGLCSLPSSWCRSDYGDMCTWPRI